MMEDGGDERIKIFLAYDYDLLAKRLHDFPLPETPVIATILFFGIVTSMFFKLWT